MTDLHQIATKLATNMKAANDDDAGNFWFSDEHGHLTDDEWSRVCQMADQMLPTIDAPEDLRRAYAEAAQQVRAEARAERVFAGDI